MFCPNCGKDCGSAKFCPECGQKLQGKFEQEQKSPVWSVGMPCPHCGGTKLDGNNCAFCGAQLVLPEDIENHKHDKCDLIPYGIYQGVYGYLKLREEYLVIQNSKGPEVTIPYDEIEEILHYPDRMFRFACLCIRWKGNAYKPLPEWYEVRNDETSFVAHVGDEDLLFQIYHALIDYCGLE